MLPSLRIVIVTIGIALSLSGCASTQQRAGSSCYWPGPVAHSCQEFVEFNSWR